jgi:hypothetical protein
MKKIFFLCLILITKITHATEYVHYDEIRGGINQVVVTASNNSNAKLIFFEREKAIELQFNVPEHQLGVAISNPNSHQWPKINTAKYSIRFDFNNDSPVILDSLLGYVGQQRMPDGKIRYALALVKAPANYEKFFVWYQACNRVVVEYNGSIQLVFTKN